MDEENQPEATWNSGMAEEFRNDPSLKDFTSLDGLAKSYVNQKQMLGGSIRRPGPDAPAEDVAKFNQNAIEMGTGLVAMPDLDNADAVRDFHKQMGLPEDASGYDRPEKWEGMSDEGYGALTKIAHEVGMSKDQFTMMTNAIAGQDNTAHDAANLSHNSAMDTLKGEWGNAYDQKRNKAANAVKQLGGSESEVAAILDGSAGAEALRRYDKISESFSEGGSLVSQEAMVTENTPNELRAQMEEMQRSMADMDASDPRYEPMRQKWMAHAGKLAPGNI